MDHADYWAAFAYMTVETRAATTSSLSEIDRLLALPVRTSSEDKALWGWVELLYESSPKNRRAWRWYVVARSVTNNPITGVTT